MRGISTLRELPGSLQQYIDKALRHYQIHTAYQTIDVVASIAISYLITHKEFGDIAQTLSEKQVIEVVKPAHDYLRETQVNSTINEIYLVALATINWCHTPEGLNYVFSFETFQSTGAACRQNSRSPIQIKGRRSRLCEE